ncbi:hypothetical protein G9463_23125 [Haloarcula sp. JP-Z28]|uniref:hypothetical protein n=1 Tax=Haloarcula sp. JP-Z28 TaxID=2716715 RepID=UPI00140528A7|nr:hypothetical protein [Haloarcula sp. JP-Z28]NHN66101.1 hypothetical protein [Haloarcula sp. JP-Z28]
MRVNRRSVLLGLGTLSATVGGAFGSGAFSSVEATRSVNIETSDDSRALLSFEANKLGTTNGGTPEDTNGIISTTPEGSDTSVIEIKQTNLNKNATTTFKNALKVSNDSNKDVGLSVNPDETEYEEDASASGLVGSALDIETPGTDGRSIVDSDSEGDNAVDLAAGTEITLTIVVDLRNNTDADIDDIKSIVFAARRDDYSSA